MHAIRRFLTTVSVLISLCSCHPNSDLQASYEQPADEPAPIGNSSFQCTSSKKSLACIEEACSFAGGDFSAELKKCSCPNQNNFVINGSRPECAPQIVRNECLETRNGFQRALKDPEAWSLCTSFQMPSPNGSSTSNVYLDLDHVTPRERETFARWADRSLTSEFAYQFWDSPIAFGDHLSVGDRIASKMVIDGILKPYNLPDEPIEYINFSLSPKHFKSVNEAIAYLQARTEKTQIDDRTLKTFSHSSPAVAKLMEYYLDGARDTKYIVESRYQEGCLRSCVARSEKIDLGGYHAWSEKFYFHGALYRSELRLSDTRGFTVAALILADRAVSIALQFERTTFGTLKRVTAMRPDGQILFEQNGPDLSNLDSDYAWFRERQNRFDLKIGLCEEGLSREELVSADLGQPVVIGPETKNFFGWSKTPGYEAYWMGRLNLNNYGLSDPGGNSKHAVQTAGVLVRWGDPNVSVGLIPLGIESCVYPNRISGWWENFKNSGARVVNMSASEELDAATCKDVMKGHPLVSEPNSALWVAAAGNQGAKRARGCPQHLAGHPSLIIVGASHEAQMHSKSNFGEEIVDIVTQGDSIEWSAWGTSFAAPRVSRVAAEIFRQYPQLSPQQVRLAILLGADIPSKPLPVRSMGHLNATNAKVIAAALADGKQPEDLIRPVFCGTAGRKCKVHNLKLNVLERLKQERRNP